MRSPKTGDYVFCYIDDEPYSGEVLSTGKDGCLVATEDNKNGIGVLWENVTGIKQSGPTDHEILEDGEEGMIVMDHKGYRRYISKVSYQQEEINPVDDQHPASDDKIIKTKYGQGIVEGEPGEDGLHVKLESGEVIKVLWSDVIDGDNSALT